ncbi:MAG: DUF6114 domain-containing protein [Gemmatimonadota bacterium]
MTSAGPGRREAGTPRRARLRFRAWRRSRPFWGGLLLILAGTEILLLPLYSLLAHSAFKVVIYIGIGGVFGVLIGGLLIACGLLAWFHPVQRIFYGITGVLLSIASFPATNLGGFFLGMLCGVFGASMVFAWSPVQPQDAGRHRHGDPRSEAAGIGDVLSGPGPDRPPRRGRLLALPVVPLLLAGTLAPGQAPALARQAAPAGSSCLLPSILSFLCPPASPSPAAAAASPSASLAGTATPAVSPSPSVSPSPDPSPSPSGSGPATPSPSPSVNPNAHKRASAAPALVAAAQPATLTAGSALMAGLSYDGVATLPTADGPQQMLKFSMSSLTLSGGIVLTVGGNGHSMVTRNSSVHFTGNVVLYATRLSGDLLGIPLSFSPQNPPPLVLPLMQFTNVVTKQPLTSADAMDASGLDITG